MDREKGEEKSFVFLTLTETLRMRRQVSTPLTMTFTERKYLGVHLSQEGSTCSQGTARDG